MTLGIRFSCPTAYPFARIVRVWSTSAGKMCFDLDPELYLYRSEHYVSENASLRVVIHEIHSVSTRWRTPTARSRSACALIGASSLKGYLMRD